MKSVVSVADRNIIVQTEDNCVQNPRNRVKLAFVMPTPDDAYLLQELLSRAHAVRVDVHMPASTDTQFDAEWAFFV
jgi:hypothetical protein